MQYTNRISFSGDRSKAFEVATTTLTALGFRIVSQEQSSLRFTGPGMRSTRQSPLLGASMLSISFQHDELVMEAELTGIKRMTQFLIFFPGGLALFFLLLFGLLFHERGFGFVILISVLPLLPWLVLTPLLSHIMKTRTFQALDTFLNNIAVSGNL